MSKKIECDWCCEPVPGNYIKIEAEGLRFNRIKTKSNEELRFNRIKIKPNEEYFATITKKTGFIRGEYHYCSEDCFTKDMKYHLLEE